MARICPFRGYRYKKESVGDLNLVVTQPFDKISEDLRQQYYRRSPFSVVRVTRSHEKNENPETDYPEAGRTLQRWIEEGVLCQDPLPALYAYYQEYEIEGEKKLQRGFIALLDLKHSGSAILPHERTLAEPRQDRLRLLRRIECNEDSIYTLYTDDRLVVSRLLEEQVSARDPEIEVSDDFGAIHRIWAVTDPKAATRIQGAMVPEELFIADGHHRYETALNYMKECEAQRWKPLGTESFDKRMIACFNSADQGTTILSTHRLIRDLPRLDSQSLLKEAEQYFQVQTVPSGRQLFAAMKEGRKSGHWFGFYPRDTQRFYLLILKEESKVDPLMLAYPEAYRHLDVSILHTLILDRFLGIDEAKLSAQSHVDYARDPDACIRAVGEGRYQAAFFLNPTSVEQVQRVALLGERMPQKSTDFYPKLLTGLVFMKMRIAKP